MDAYTYLIKAAAILGIFYLIYRLLLRKETHFKSIRVYLILGIIASFLLPLWYFTRTTVVEIPAISESFVAYSDSQPGLVSTGEEYSAPGINWAMLSLYAYAAIAGLLIFRLLFQLGQLAYLIRSNPRNRSGAFTYIEVNDGYAPFSFLQYIFYNPKAHSREELEMILKHEQVHAFQWHSVDILLANMLVCIQWANPFSWLYRKSISENLEFLADEGTITSIPSKKEYQLALIKASAQTVPALTTSFYQSFIKKRIIMLNKESSRPLSLLKVILIVPLIAVFLYSFNVKEETQYKEVQIPESNPVIASSPEPEEVITEEPVIATASSAVIEFNEEDAISPVLAVDESPYVVAMTDENPVQPEVMVLSMKDIKFIINKNTTDAELEEMKAKVKQEHGLDMSYSVGRNSNDEIISISLSYSGGNRNGSYNISGDEPIEEFFFYINDDGESGFWSEAAEARKLEREAARAERMLVRAERLARAKEDRDERREEIIIEREAMRDEMAKRRKEMRDKMRDKAKYEKIIIEQEKDKKRLHEKYKEAEKRYKIAKAKGQGSATVIELDDGDGEIMIIEGGSGRAYTAKAGIHEHAVVIDKDTSDETLSKIKKKLAADGIDFKYSKVKRNKNGEITRIKIEVDDNEGGKQSILNTTSDGDPIDMMIIDLN